MTTSSRQARLRPEFAALYPGIVPDRWESASVLTDKVVALRASVGSVGLLLRERALAPAHFEFRECAPPPLRLVDRHTRRTDSRTSRRKLGQV